MTTTIHKFALRPEPDQDIEMPCGPSGIQLLHVFARTDYSLPA